MILQETIYNDYLTLTASGVDHIKAIVKLCFTYLLSYETIELITEIESTM